MVEMVFRKSGLASQFNKTLFSPESYWIFLRTKVEYIMDKILSKI
jgi:hypothetical protein